MFWKLYPADGFILLVFLANASRGWILSLSPDTKCGKCSTKEVGESMTFTCEIIMETGDSEPSAVSIRWLDQSMRPIKRVTFNTLYRVFTNQTTNEALYLHITHIKESDAGSYTCEGQSSQSGSVLRRSTSLVVIKDVKIQFLETPETQYPRVNANALIRCLPEANPQPVTTWYFKGQPLVGGSRYTIAENGLIIHRLTKEDEGTYICKAEIPSENRAANRTIAVIPASTPMINKPLNDVIGAFDQVRVKCMASGKPVPNYHWFKSGSADTLNEPKFHVDNTTGVLIINNLTRADEGKYICIASNPAGDTIATVDVKNVTEIPTAILAGQSSVQRGDNLTLYCDVTGYPPPRVVWHLPGHSLRWLPETISADSRITIQWRNTTRLQLFIKNVSSTDGGQFFCSAENMGGSQNASLSVLITGEHSPTRGIPSNNNSPVLHAAWGAVLGIIVIIVILVIGSIIIRRHRKGQRLMSSNMVVCSSCLVCIKDNKSQRSSSGGTLQNASSKEKIAFSELIDTPENSRKDSLSIISPNSPCGKDNDVSPEVDEKDTILRVVEYDNNLNEGKPIKKIEMKEGGYTELPLV